MDCTIHYYQSTERYKVRSEASYDRQISGYGVIIAFKVAKSGWLVDRVHRCIKRGWMCRWNNCALVIGG